MRRGVAGRGVPFVAALLILLCLSASSFSFVHADTTGSDGVRTSKARKLPPPGENQLDYCVLQSREVQIEVEGSASLCKVL